MAYTKLAGLLAIVAGAVTQAQTVFTNGQTSNWLIIIGGLVVGADRVAESLETNGTVKLSVFKDLGTRIENALKALNAKPATPVVAPPPVAPPVV